MRLQTLRAMQAEAPSAPVANAIGVAELRRTATPSPAGRRITSARRPSSIPSDGDLFFNLGYAYWLDKDPRAAIYWLREAVRRDPGDGDAHFILGVALAADRRHRRSHARARARGAAVVEVRRAGRRRRAR